MKDTTSLPTIVQALVSWGPDQITAATDTLARNVLSFSDREANAAVKAWAWLLGESAGNQILWGEVLDDADVLLALHRPLTQFVEWFRCLDWWSFGRTAIDGGQDDDWAFEALQRARELRNSLGSMAGQISVVEAVARMV